MNLCACIFRRVCEVIPGRFELKNSQKIRDKKEEREREGKQ